MRLALDGFCLQSLVKRRALFLADMESKAVNTTPRAALAKISWDAIVQKAFGFSPHFSSRQSPVEAFTHSPQAALTFEKAGS